MRPKSMHSAVWILIAPLADTFQTLFLFRSTHFVTFKRITKCIEYSAAKVTIARFFFAGFLRRNLSRETNRELLNNHWDQFVNIFFLSMLLSTITVINDKCGADFFANQNFLYQLFCIISFGFHSFLAEFFLDHKLTRFFEFIISRI